MWWVKCGGCGAYGSGAEKKTTTTTTRFGWWESGSLALWCSGTPVLLHEHVNRKTRCTYRLVQCNHSLQHAAANTSRKHMYPTHIHAQKKEFPFSHLSIYPSIHPSIHLSVSLGDPTCHQTNNHSLPPSLHRFSTRMPHNSTHARAISQCRHPLGK